MLQNHLFGIEGVQVQNKSCQLGGGLLRVAASSNWNWSFHRTLRDEAVQAGYGAEQIVFDPATDSG